MFIKEAGEIDCIRGEDPLISGMKITKQGEVQLATKLSSIVPISNMSYPYSLLSSTITSFIVLISVFIILIGNTINDV